MTDEFKDEIRDRMEADLERADLEDELGLSDHPYVKFFNASQSVRDIVDRVIGAWDDWPTDPGAAPLWATAFGETTNQNAPDVQRLDPFEERENILNLGASPEEVDAIRQYRDFVRDYTRSQEGDTIRAYRYVEDPPEEAERFEGRTIESWTDNPGRPRKFARAIRGERESGSVLWTEDMPVDRLYGTPDTHPELDEMGQDEIIVAHPPNTILGEEYNVTALSEWEF